jgi:hypothetical protein
MPKAAWEPPYETCGHRRKEARGGGKCLAKAGAGTDHPGYGRCKHHGGNTKDNKTHAARLEAKERLNTLGVALDIKPHDALEAMVAVSAGAVAWLRDQIADIPTDELLKHESRVLTTMYGAERDRLVRTSKAAVESGVAERQVRLAEQQGEITVKLVRKVLAGLGLTREQEATAKELVRAELAALVVADGSTADGSPSSAKLLGK